MISEDGTVKVIGIDDIEYDTLSNGKVVAKGLPGQLAQVPIEDNDAYLRTNYDTSNNINLEMAISNQLDTLMILKMMNQQ